MEHRHDRKQKNPSGYVSRNPHNPRLFANVREDGLYATDNPLKRGNRETNEENDSDDEEKVSHCFQFSRVGWEVGFLNDCAIWRKWQGIVNCRPLPNSPPKMCLFFQHIFRRKSGTNFFVEDIGTNLCDEPRLIMHHDLLQMVMDIFH